MECITTSYGKVCGRAAQYPYWQPARYKTHVTKDGRLIWKYLGHVGKARRSIRLATQDAIMLSTRECPYIPRVRNNKPVAKITALTA